jgi:hypothetical protein
MVLCIYIIGNVTKCENIGKIYVNVNVVCTLCGCAVGLLSAYVTSDTKY